MSDRRSQARLHLGSLDLNLLGALQAILEEASVTQAAQRMNVSQSAMSHTLKRLRKLLEDPLLIRQGNVYQLTRRAEKLRDPLRNILLQTEALFAEACFDPGSDDRTVTVAMTSSTARAVGRRLLSSIERQAPNLEVKIVAALDGPDGHFAREAIDVQLLSSIYPTQHPRKVLYEDAWVVIAGTSELTEATVLDMLASRPHIMFESGVLSLPYEILRAHGIRSDIRVRVQDTLLVPELVAGTQYVAIHRSAPVKQLPEGLGIWSVPFPFDLGTLSVDVIWNPWRQDPAFQRWFEALLIDVVQ